MAEHGISLIRSTAKVKCQGGLLVIKNADCILSTLNPSTWLPGRCSLKVFKVMMTREVT